MFYRGTAEYKGSGLGLCVAREMAEQMRGTIAVESITTEGNICYYIFSNHKWKASVPQANHVIEGDKLSEV